MTQKLAFSKMKVKQIDDERREIVGIASSISPDRDEDILLPEGAVFTLPIPLIWGHNHEDAVGEVYEAKVIEGQGIEIKARIANVEGPSQLRERLNEAWERLKAGLVRGLSVGFRPIEWVFIEGTNGVKFIKWDWYELSLVTVPANSDATLAVIKEYAAKSSQAAIGTKSKTTDAFYLKKPGAAATKSNEDIMYKEQIENFLARRKELQAERAGLMEKANKEGRTMNSEEQQKFDACTEEMEAVENHVKRLEMLQEEDKEKAVPVTPETVKSAASKASQPNRVVVAPVQAENGLAFAQYVKMLGQAKGNIFHAAEIAEREAASGKIDKRVAAAIKAAVSAGSTLSDEWAGNLAQGGGVVADFVEFMRPQTILGKFGTDGIPSLMRVPANVPIEIQTSGGDAYWVGEGKAKPLTKWEYGQTKLAEFKVATIAVLTQELIRKSTTAADQRVRDELVRAISARLDTDFMNPDKAEVANISPASITNGAPSQASAGLEADMTYLVGQLVAARIPLSSAVLIMNSANAFALSRLRDPLNNRIYPEMTITGGSIDGIPAIVSDYAGDVVALVAANEIYLVDEGGLQVDMSDQASLEMSDAPTGDSVAPTAAQLVSMWQTNSVAFRAERFINWKRRRSSAVAYVTDADYSVTPPVDGEEG